MDRRVDHNKDPKLTVTEGIHDAPPEPPETEIDTSKPFIPDQRKKSVLETRAELLEKEPQKLNMWLKRALGFTGVVALGGGVAALWLELDSGEKAPKPSEAPKPSATASAFPSSKAEITPTTTSVAIETTSPPKETFPMTVDGIAKKLKITPDVKAAEMPERFVEDANALFGSFDDFDEMEKWFGKTATDPVKGQVYGVDALMTTYQQGIYAAYGKNYYSDFLAQEVMYAATQVALWEGEKKVDVKKRITLLPTSVKDLADYPEGKLVNFAIHFETKGGDESTKEVSFQVGSNISNGVVNLVSQLPPKIVELPR